MAETFIRCTFYPEADWEPDYTVERFASAGQETLRETVERFARERGLAYLQDKQPGESHPCGDCQVIGYAQWHDPPQWLLFGLSLHVRWDEIEITSAWAEQVEYDRRFYYRPRPSQAL